MRIVVEHSPIPQPVREMRLDGGELSIGRGADCDWQLDDPDMFVSRRHCILSGRAGSWRVTDASRGGLFIDGAEDPLGAGNSAPIGHGTRLRLGDVVLRVEVDPETRPAADPPPARRPVSFDSDDFFARLDAPAPPAPRPDTLPDPFEEVRRAPPTPKAPEFDGDFLFDPPPRLVERPKAPEPWDAASFRPDDPFSAQPPQAVEAAHSPASATDPAQHREWPSKTEPEAPGNQDRLVQAFYRGLGLPPQAAGEAEMEAMGRRFRALAEGLVLLLRSRAREKGSARVPQTVIGSSSVNPLKFLATLDEGVGALTSPRGPGYLDPDAAIEASFRDLADHQMRNWTAIQTSLRRMVDRFDPARFEAEIEREGLVSQILAGGRSARLWQLYTDRYREMARAAEDRFLGEIGADFREAYEGQRRKDDA
ncbi:type VI secretion system-associated FHA domain protein TagH [Rhodobacter sp. CZR27]|uniref:type VI secretion system-associated FHA domain protein TagH n=1 Tax=Rhodobacter sp. CZR27 TaxID=2033869 RepID=UPI001E30C6E6|nr:type VI secretion system-associated FHA domain protein TagH [Rhodobacter sp. CZR27]